jgi:DNA topoisomerase-1
MSKKLVIVESPAKAKTISRFLGNDYVVEASFGHIRDLPEKASEIPDEHKKKPWARLGVDVTNGFQPLYVVPSSKSSAVSKLRQSMKGADTLLLATDEDREGESISWHILQVLRVPKATKVERIVFHEITPEAIEAAIKSPRKVDEALVRAQETRRILDRLYGYSLSPVLWKKVAPKLSAGRVQSIAVKLLVEREKRRIAFVSAEYWGIESVLQAKKGKFKSRLVRIDGAKVAGDGSDFDPMTGKLLDPKTVLLDAKTAEALANHGKDARPWVVSKLDKTPGSQTPPVPFMTSTLQQEASRKLRFPARKTMQIAQQLYEGVDLKGERVGLITYMRTDSLTLAERALEQAREVIVDLYGKEYLPKTAKRYKTKAQGAQEAHEAIRPTDLTRRPQDVRSFLTSDQAALYDLIWKRTIASQMVPAKLERTAVEVKVTLNGKDAIFTASGSVIKFPGFLKAYVEGSDDPDAELADRETVLPEMKQGDELTPESITANERKTKPPLRYTEASLVKKLEEEGIGRPSTYATILGTIQDRGYCFQRGNELIPTFVAFGVTELLETHFAELMDVKFTAKMEQQLDEIAEGHRDWVEHLTAFYLSKGKHKGLVDQISEQEPEMAYPRILLGVDPQSGEDVVVRIGRSGCFIQKGEGESKATSNVPEKMPPDELTLEKAIELLSGAVPSGQVVASTNGRNVMVKSGRYGDYVEVELTDEEKKAGVDPKRVTLPPDLKPETVSDADIEMLLQLPRNLGKGPSGDPVMASVGRYGAYVKSGTEARSLESWQDAVTVTLEKALDLLSKPKTMVRRTSGKVEPLRELRAAEGDVPAVKVMIGRFGPYVTDGTTNATIPRGVDPETFTLEAALTLLATPKEARSGREAIQEFPAAEGTAGPMRVLSGRFGPYVTDGKVNATLPRGTDPASITADECAVLIRAKAAAGPSPKKKFVKKKKR